MPGGRRHAHCEPDKDHPGPDGHSQFQTHPARACLRRWFAACTSLLTCQPCADRRQSVGLFVDGPRVHFRDRLAAGGRRIRNLGPPLGSGLAHTSPPEVALPIARQFIQCLLWSLLPKRGFRHSAPQRKYRARPTLDARAWGTRFRSPRLPPAASQVSRPLRDHAAREPRGGALLRSMERSIHCLLHAMRMNSSDQSGTSRTSE